MCRRLQSLEASCSEVSLLQPLSTCSAGWSLKALDVACCTDQDIGALEGMLPFLRSLQKLSFSLPPVASEAMRPDDDLVKQLLSQMPPTIISLAISDLSLETAKHLAGMFAGGHFGALERLYLYSMRIRHVCDADCFYDAFRLSAGKKMKTLHLQVSGHFDGRSQLVCRMMGLHKLEEKEEIFPQLSTLILGRFEDWNLLGVALLSGKFPKLHEIYRRTSFKCGAFQGDFGDAFQGNWYDFDVLTTRLFFRVFRTRKITWLGPIYYLYDEYTPEPLSTPSDLVKEILTGFGQPLDCNVISYLKELIVERPALDNMACQLLVEAITSRNLIFLQMLSFVFGERHGSESIKAVGQVLDCDFLPELNILSIGFDDDMLVHQYHWELFFAVLPANNIMPQLEELIVPDHSLEIPVGSFFYGLTRQQADPEHYGLTNKGTDPVVFRKLSSITLDGIVRSNDLQLICDALDSGRFPTLKAFEVRRK